MNFISLILLINIYYIINIISISTKSNDSYQLISEVHKCIQDSSISYLKTSKHLDCIKSFDHDYKISSLVKNTGKKEKTLIKLNFSIKQKNLDKLEGMLMDVSMPNSKNYGKHLKQSEVKAMFHDTDAALKVETWLKESCDNIFNLINTGNAIAVILPISCAEELLKTEFYYFKSDSNKYLLVINN